MGVVWASMYYRASAFALFVHDNKTSSFESRDMLQFSAKPDPSYHPILRPSISLNEPTGLSLVQVAVSQNKQRYRNPGSQSISKRWERDKRELNIAIDCDCFEKADDESVAKHPAYHSCRERHTVCFEQPIQRSNHKSPTNWHPARRPDNPVSFSLARY